MHFVLIIAFTIGLSAEALDTGLALADVPQRWAALGFGVGFVALFAMVIATAIRSQLVQRFDHRAQIMALFQRLRWVHTAVALAIYAIIIYVVEWPTLVRNNIGLRDWILLDEVFILLPFLVPLILSWGSFYRVDRVMRAGLAAMGGRPPTPWTRWQYMGFHVRHYLVLILVPAFLLLALHDALRLYLPPAVANNEWLKLGVLAGMAAVLMALAPLLVRLAWQARSLPPGPLRDRLHEVARQTGFRYTDILVWQTGRAVVNAAVTGVVGRLRYVLLSDGLCEALTEEEIVAVFGHEIGHVKHHHMLFYFFFVLTSLLVLTCAGEVAYGLLQLFPSVDARTVVQGLPFTLGVITIYFGLVFGFVSRRFERQADLFGCRAFAATILGREKVSGTIYANHPPGPERKMVPDTFFRPLLTVAVEVFVGALERIAYLNGVSRNLRSWRHFSIARRVDFLRRLAADPHLAHRFEESVLRLKLVTVLCILALTVYLVAGTLPIWAG